jgi:hypothetical protein
MFQNILKWTFKVVVDGVEKELHLHLDGDTPLQAVEQVAMQMIAHCSKVKEANASQAAAQPVAPVEPPAASEPKPGS